MFPSIRSAPLRVVLCVSIASFLLLLGLLTKATAQAQDVAQMDNCSGGTLYYLAFPDTTTNTFDTRFPAQLLRTKTTAFNFYIYSPVSQEIKIGRFAGETQTVQLAAGQILEYNTSQIGVPFVTVINTPQTNALKLEAQYPVIVYGYMMTAFGTEAYTAIPVESWGTEYFAAAWPAQMVRDEYPSGEFNYRAVPKGAGAEILIFAAYDNTEVQIMKAPDAFLDCTKCGTVTLKAGEAYLVESVADTSASAKSQVDLGGTFIQSNKPIGVISGNPRLMNNAGERPALAENSYKNSAIEWIPPVDQLGTEFVYLPTWDDRHPREGLDAEESRGRERVRLFATEADPNNPDDTAMTAFSYDEKGKRVNLNDEIMAGEAITDKVDNGPIPRYYKTSRPALAIMSPDAVVKYNGTTTYGANYVGAAYKSWSTYMVELVPREQWTSFAPVRAPSLPSSMIHYLNVVTDTNHQFNVFYGQGGSPRQLFPFNRGKVPGTDLVWGSVTLNKGVDYFLEGEKGARFSGNVYGSYGGQEQYRPGGTKKEEKGGGVSGGGSGSDPQALHPSEYEEDMALMYSYPLAPSRCIIGSSLPGYHIETQQDCGVMTIQVIPDGEDSPGLRSALLVTDSSENVRLEFVQPSNPGDLSTTRQVTLRLVAIDPTEDADGVLMIKDGSRESRPIRVEYHYRPDRAELDPADNLLLFSDLVVNETATEKSVTISNPMDRSITVKRLNFILGNERFRIKRTEPAFDWSTGQDQVVLAPGEKLTVWIDITPDQQRVYQDSLRIELGCNVVRTIVVRAIVSELCLMVGDLDFGEVEIDHSKTLELEICNRGGGPITFQDPWLTWLGGDFGVAPADIDKLKGLTLKKDECVRVNVIFSAGDTGSFSTIARLWANTRSCRDTSVWKVRVVDPSLGVAGEDVADGYAIGSITPNPFNEETGIEFRLGHRGQTRIEVYDAGGKRVATPAEGMMESGDHYISWDAEGLAAGVYLIRIHSGSWSGTRQVILVR